MRKYNLFGIFLLGFLLFSTSFGFVAAQDVEPEDEDDDGIDDDFEEENKRDIELEISDNEFQIESQLRNGDIKDQIKLKVTYDSDGLGIKISYEEELDSEGVVEADSEFELEFKVEFRKIIEFVDLDDNGMYDKAIDQVVQEYDLDSFQPIGYTTSILSDDTVLHYLIVNTTDGMFAVHIFFAEEFAVVNGTFISPTQTKFDIEITNFNYLEDNSQLALYVKLESEQEYEEDDQTDDEDDGYVNDEDGIIVESNGYSGIFTWNETALVDGVVMDVLSNAIEVDDEDEYEQKLILNYPRGNHIYHDPKVGITFGQVSTSPLPLVLIGTIIASVAIIGVVAIVLLKKRRIA